MNDEQLIKLKENLCKEEKLNNYIWNYRVPGTINEYISKKLVDMDEAELLQRLSFCTDMLESKHKPNYGRKVVYSKIEETIDKLNAELMLREDVTKSGMSRSQILDIIKSQKVSKDALFGDIVNTEYKFGKIPIKIIADACKNNLGMFDSGMISYTFVTKIGVCPDSKFKEAYKKFVATNGEMNHVEFVRSYLNIPDKFKCYVGKKGLTLAEAEVATNFKSCNFSELSTSEIKLLVDKLLLLLLDRIQKQINDWEERRNNIIEVLNYKTCSNL